MKTPLSMPRSRGALALSATIETRRESRWQFRVPRAATRWMLFALGVRFVAAILIHLYSLAAGYGGFYPLASGSDDIIYWITSNGFYTGKDTSYVVNAYPLVLSMFYHLVGGPDLLLGKLLNVLIGALTVGVGVLCTQEITRGRYPEEVRRRAVKWTGMLLTFYPSLLWYSTQLVKDPILIFLIMVALYCQLLFLKRAQLAPILIWLGCLLGTMFFRPYAAAALLFALALFVMRFNRKLIVPVLLFMALAPMAKGMGPFAINYIQPMVDANRLAEVRSQAYSIGGSSAGITVDFSNPFRFAATYSYSFATAMFGPFPWQIKAVGQAVALPEALGVWLLIPFWFRSVKDVLRGRGARDKIASRDASLLLFSLVLIGLVALFSDNIGANTRLRLLPWSAFFIYAAPHLAKKKWKLW